MPSKDKRKLAAIMFADVVGYSRMMANNEERTLELLKDFENICSPIISKLGGEIIKKVGDELFCEFSSAKQAVDSALAIQEAIQPYNDSRPKDFKLHIRIGIHVGDIVLRDGDVFGDGVNVASRIQPFANPGGICISSTVKEAVSSHPNYNIISEGQQELKNILERHSLYRVETGYELVDKNKPKLKKKNKWTIGLLIFIILTFILTITDSNLSLHFNNLMISLGKTEFQTPGKYLVHVISDNKNISEVYTSKDNEQLKYFEKNLREISKKEIKRINSQIISELITKYYHEERQYYFLDDMIDMHPYDFSDFKKINPYNSDNFSDNAFYKEYLSQTEIRTCYIVHIYKNELDDKYRIFVSRFSNDGSAGISFSPHDNEDDIVEKVVNEISRDTDRENVSRFIGSVLLSENNTVVIQLYEDSKLTKGAILHLYRYYLFTDENYDIAKTKRLNDLNIGIDYLENNNKDENLLRWKKKERQQLQDGTFLNYNYGNIGRDLGITVKIISIEGNKGIGTIIKQKYPWIEINKGDKLEFKFK